MKTNKAFTLAEVLITLVVIGIIAAITVPTIMENHKKTEYSARLKKFYSTMSNAVKLAETEWGMPAYEWDFSIGSKESFEKYLAKYLNCTLGEVREVSYGNDLYGIVPIDSELVGNGNDLDACFLNDGTFFSFNASKNNTGQNYIGFVYDLNGNKKPNIEGRDQFIFITGANGPPANTLEENICKGGFVPNAFDSCWGINIGQTREEAYNYCKGGENLCAYLLFLDGWEFKDDYPHRL